MKIPIGLKVSKEVKDEVDRLRQEEGFNFNDWVEMTFIREKMTEKGLKNQLDLLKIQQKSAQNRLTYLKREGQNRLNLLKKSLTTEMKEHIKETKKLLKEHPEYLDGRIKLWNSTFKNDISKLDFMKLLGVI